MMSKIDRPNEKTMDSDTTNKTGIAMFKGIRKGNGRATNINPAMYFPIFERVS